MNSENDNNQNYYKILSDNISSQSNYLDNALLTLSSGAIGLIAAFLKDDNCSLDGYLRVSSFLFLLTIVSILFSAFCSIKAHQKAIQAVSDNVSFDINSCKWNKLTSKLTEVSFVFFCFACGFMIFKYL